MALLTRSTFSDPIGLERVMASKTITNMFTSIQTPGDPFTRGAFKVWCWPINESACLAGLGLGAATVAEFGPQGQELGLWWLLWRHKPIRAKKSQN